VELTISGPAPTFQNLQPRDFRVNLDLGGREAGQHSVPLQPVVPAGFTLENLNPGSLTVTLRPTPQPTPAGPTG
jgi:hypothetical protein